MSSAVEQSGRFADMKLPAMDVHVDNGDQKDDDAHVEEDPKPKQIKEDVAIEENDDDEDDEEQEIDHKPAPPRAGGLDDLHEALSRLRRESQLQIQKLRQESEDASRTIEKLQQQLLQQSDYETLKREIQLLKQGGGIGAPSVSGANTTPSLDMASAADKPAHVASIEMLLALERAKMMQQQQCNSAATAAAAAAIKAFTDMQAGGGSFGGSPLRHPLFPPVQPVPGMDFGLMGEDVVARWRSNFEQHQFGFPGPNAPALRMPGVPTSSSGSIPLPPSLPTVPVTPPAGNRPSSILRTSSPGCGSAPPSASPSRPRSADRSPSGDRSGSPDDARRSPLTNGDECRDGENSDCDDDGGPAAASTPSHSPLHMDGLKSPLKMEDSPHFPMQMHHSPMGLPLQLPLSVPPLMSTGRIPKSDPMEGRLQDMLRYNMEKYSGQALDTLGTSRRVRELLSIHNIGQRLFAKYVLGLSQGTVSELLSKPKSWEKLTEKGRDSYRKMHAWAYDEQAVMLLKSLIPRKGELVRTTSAGPSLIMKGGDHTPVPAAFPFSMPDPSVTQAMSHLSEAANNAHHHHQQQQEERIAKILNEASKAMKEESQPALSPGGMLPMPSADSTPDRMSQLYSEELARIMKQSRLLPSLPASSPSDILKMGLGSGADLGGLPSAPFGLFGRNAPAELQRAMDMYQQELSRLQQNAIAAAIRQQNAPGSGMLLLPKEELLSKQELLESGLKRVKGGTASTTPEKHSPVGMPDCIEKQLQSTPPSSHSSPSPSQMGRSPVGGGAVSALFPPTSSSGNNGEEMSSSLSPLQRMASITNALVTQPHLPAHAAGLQPRPHRAVLPPITQQQFDKFQHLNTDELVRKIKEILSQYSISQRLFGESVLGLSQGSVSDLLARPKPWHMLTQKGREPFIRMKLFLDDENAVHKLVASQYKIAPEKLMRTGSFSASHLGPHGKMPKLAEFPPRSLAPDAPLSPLMRFGSQPLNVPAAPDAVSAAAMFDPLALHRKLLSQKVHALSAAGPLPPQPLAPQQISPSLYEMAALTHELDTQAVTTKVKEILLANNVGQKLFGEAVLGLSQGSVSELLSKPKPWHMLSIKGREPFIRMQLWLNDPQSMDKLQSLKSERRDSAKRKRMAGGSGGGAGSGLDSSSECSSPAEPNDYYGSSLDSPGAAKKQRILFSDEQKEALRVAFALDPYPSTAVMDFLSQELGIESRTISNWFHNHRMRLKQHSHSMEGVLGNGNGASSNFDPVKFRLLCHQRMMEVRAAPPNENSQQSDCEPALPNSVTSFLRQFGLPSALAVAAAASSEDDEARPFAMAEGLDLSFKCRSSGEADRDSLAASSEDNNNNDDEDDDPAAPAHLSRSALASVSVSVSSKCASGRSRRKPAAPQWLRPEREAQADPDEDVNGACQTAEASPQPAKQNDHEEEAAAAMLQSEK